MFPRYGQILVSSFLVLLLLGASAGSVNLQQGLLSLSSIFEGLRNEIVSVRKTMGAVGKQLMMQQLFVEEKIRGDGNSGIKVVRGGRKGLKNYESYNHIGLSYASMHDHSNYDRTIGLGEVSVVMNGVDFRTRHNDFKLVMADTNSDDYHAVVNIPFPEVPPEVSNLTDVADQVVEMREWFRAFVNQDPSVRDYTKYFKPVFCYLEGAWTMDKELEEPFPSDRHHLEAKSWDDLVEKVRFSAFSGTKPRFENFAFLPSSVLSVNSSTGEPTITQWVYRILCHPLNRDLPMSVFHQEDDMSYRVRKSRTMKEVQKLRTARFSLFNLSSSDDYQILDEIFREIPGKDNRPKQMTQISFDNDVMLDMMFPREEVLVDTSMYHRWYRADQAGAMGLAVVSRGFNDDNLWVAQTTQSRVAPIGLTFCNKARIDGRLEELCNKAYNRFSYAIPLEIIFLTPLLSWNPYNLKYHEELRIADAGKRTGLNSVEKAFDGVDKQNYYLTPVEFYKADSESGDPADTVKAGVHVLDPNGNIRKTSASGMRILSQDIEGIGSVRLRYPIAPVHGEGSSVWKELNALRDRLTGNEELEPTYVDLETSAAYANPPGEHTHEVSITYQEFLDLVNNGKEIFCTTSFDLGHSHDLILQYVKSTQTIRYNNCDGDSRCFDGHNPKMFLLTENIYTELP